MPLEVKEPSLISVSPYASFVAREMYPGELGQDDRQDAARHMLAAGTLTRKYGPRTAHLLGKVHEYATSPLAALKTLLGVGSMPADFDQDIHNNTLGVDLAGKSTSQADLERLVNLLAEQSQESQHPGIPWVGRQQPSTKQYAQGGSVEVKDPIRCMAEKYAPHHPGLRNPLHKEA